MRTNIVKVTLGRLTTVSKKQLWKEDYGQKIQFIGVDLPYRYEVDFADSPTGQAITMIGDETGVLVPDELLQNEGNIYAYLYLHTGADDGETQYTVILPVEQRAERTDIEPTPVQQNIIEQTIVALNDAVEKTAADVVAADASAQAAAGSAETAGQAKDDAVEAKDKAVEAKNAAETAQGKAEDAQRAAEQAAGSVLGLTADATVDANVGTPSVEVEVTTEADHKNMSFAFHNLKGVQGDPGDPGVGISSVVLNADYTLTITLTNGVSYTTSSIRGEVGATPNLTIGMISTLPEGSQATATITGTSENPVLNLGIPVGDTGDPGISPTITVTTITGGHEVKVVDAEGTHTFDVMDGEVSEEQLETALIDKADVIISSASGEIVTIADGGKDMPVVDLSVSLLPIQNLNGQDAPYPPGGGKNKFYIENKTVSTNGVTGVMQDGVITVTGTATQNTYLNFGTIQTPSGTVVFSDGLNDRRMYLYASGETTVYSGDSFTGGSEKVVYILVYPDDGAVNKTYKPQIESGSTPSAWQPYSNVYPISGWTGVEVYSTPDFHKCIPTIGSSWTSNGITIDHLGNGKYRIHGTSISSRSIIVPIIPFVIPSGDGRLVEFNNNVANADCMLYFYSSTGSSFDSWIMNVVNRSSNAYNAAAGKTIGNLGFSVSNGATVDMIIDPTFTKNKTTIPISWQSSAGTVYGCNIDPVSGVLTVDRVLETITDESDITYRANGIFQYQTADYFIKPRLSSINLFLSNYLKPYAVLGYTGLTENYSIGFYNSTDGTRSKIVYFTLDKTAVTSGALAQAYLQNNPITFVYPLDTKVEYQLSPTQIATLLGTNVFWSNGNGVVDLEYRADTKLYIQQLTKPSEDDMTANANIASDKYFMVGNRLMLSTTAIAQGEQIVVGTNCSEVSLADALNQINA